MIVTINNTYIFFFFFRFLRDFVTKCDEIVSPKLETAKKNAMASKNNFEETLSKVSDLEKVWQEVKKTYFANLYLWKAIN